MSQNVLDMITFRNAVQDLIESNNLDRELFYIYVSPPHLEFTDNSMNANGDVMISVKKNFNLEGLGKNSRIVQLLPGETILCRRRRGDRREVTNEAHLDTMGKGKEGFYVIPIEYKASILKGALTYQPFNIQPDGADPLGFLAQDGGASTETLLETCYIIVPCTVSNVTIGDLEGEHPLPTFFQTNIAKVRAFNATRAEEAFEGAVHTPADFLSPLLYEMYVLKDMTATPAYRPALVYEPYRWQSARLSHATTYTTRVAKDTSDADFNPGAMSDFISCFSLHAPRRRYDVLFRELEGHIPRDALQMFTEVNRAAEGVSASLNLFCESEETTPDLSDVDDNVLIWLATMALNSLSMRIAHPLPWQYFYTHVCVTQAQARYEFRTKLGCMPMAAQLDEDFFKEVRRVILELRIWGDAKNSSSPDARLETDAWISLARCVSHKTRISTDSQRNDVQRHAAMRFESAKRKLASLQTRRVKKSLGQGAAEG